MLKQLGSSPFSPEYLSEHTIGHWAIEKDPGMKPRMYVDDIMLGLIGLKEQKDPEIIYETWFRGVDRKYLDSVTETARMNEDGLLAECEYPWHYPDGRIILIRSESVRNFSYTNGIRIEGKHRNITDLAHIQKEAAVISALSSDFEAVSYVIFTGKPETDVTIPFRTSAKVKSLIPGWDQEIGFHNRLKLLLESCIADEDMEQFFKQTRRAAILRELELNSVYFVNARLVFDKNTTEYYQFKFTADRDRDGKMTGMVVGMHSVDTETRKELELRNRVEKLVESQTEELSNKNRALASVNERMISMIGGIVESRDAECGNHISRVSYLTRILGMQVMRDLPEYGLMVEDISDIVAVSPLHDVGKIKLPDSVILKPGPLTNEEFALIKTHCDKGCEILQRLSDGWDPKLYRLSMDICRYHHEKWDGTGYPLGLRGDEIPIAAQIVSIADAYDALVSKRCYKDAFSHEAAFEMILSGKCGRYSEKLLDCFKKCRNAFRGCTVYKKTDIESRESDPDRLIRSTYISSAIPLIEEISCSMPNGFLIYQADADEKLLYFNDTMVRYLGCDSREEFIRYTDNSLKGIIHPSDYRDVKNAIERQLAGKTDKLEHILTRVRNKDGGCARYVNSCGQLIHSGDLGAVFFVFFEDVTDHVQAFADGR